MAAELGDVVRSIDINPFMVLPAGRDKLVKTFVRQARALIDEDGAQVIIPHGISQCPIHIKPDWLADELGVPIVEGFGAPIRLAGLGYKHSRIRWPKYQM